MRCLLLGNGAREAVMAEFLAKGHTLFCVMPYHNQSIIEAVQETGGNYQIGSPYDKETVKQFMIDNKIELCVVNSDSLLEAGLIDVAKELGIKTFGPTKKGAKIEWSKTYALDIVDKVAPEKNIKTYNVDNVEDLRKAVDNYEGADFVVKPEGLTAGKGVKVGNEHFNTKEEGFEYAKGCLEKSGNVIIQDVIKGTEFTIMGFTSGKNIVIAPITYDYPYRFDNDEGPGTGGMGCITFPDGLLPGITKDDLNQCKDVMEKALAYLNKDSVEFTGVLYGGFFKCEKGIKVIEFNSRLGDPEAINVLNALETPFADIVTKVANGEELNEENCKFKNEYTLIVCVVSPDYAVKEEGENKEFILDKNAITANGSKIYFASADHIEKNQYKPTGNSRLFGVATTGNTYEEVRTRVYEAIKENVPEGLDYRTDIGVVR